METKRIEDFTDAELAQMVRDSIYVQGTTFSPDHARFLIVMAIPYGPEDTCDTLPQALGAFHELLGVDWEERSFQVYDHETKKFGTVVPESLEEEEIA